MDLYSIVHDLICVTAHIHQPYFIHLLSLKFSHEHDNTYCHNMMSVKLEFSVHVPKILEEQEHTTMDTE
jgi:hypothetical protein